MKSSIVKFQPGSIHCTADTACTLMDPSKKYRKAFLSLIVFLGSDARITVAYINAGTNVNRNGIKLLSSNSIQRVVTFLVIQLLSYISQNPGITWLQKKT